MEKDRFALYIRNFIFGAEDSLVSTVGLLSGIFSAGVQQRELLVSGIVLIFVEAFSMSVGSFLSERTVEESYGKIHLRESNSMMAAGIMLASYFFSGFFPLAPYLIFPQWYGFWISIAISFIALSVLGFLSAKILRTNAVKSTVRMAALGGFAIMLGVAVGNVLK